MHRVEKRRTTLLLKDDDLNNKKEVEQNSSNLARSLISGNNTAVLERIRAKNNQERPDT